MVRRFFRNQKLSFPTLDQIGLSTLIGSSGFILFNAYQEGIHPLVDQDRSNDCCCKDYTTNNNNESSSFVRREQNHNRTRFTLAPEQCRIMEKEGFLVIDGFLSKDELQNAAKSARYMEHQGLFGASPNEKEENNKTSGAVDEEEMTNVNMYKNTGEEDEQQTSGQVRTDRVCFVNHHANNNDYEADSGGKHDNMDGIYHVRRLLRGIAHEVVTSDFQGFQETSSSSATGVTTKNSHNHNIHNNAYLSQNSWIGVPTSMQVSLYNRLPQQPQDKDSSKNSSRDHDKDMGAYYHAHRDGCTDSFMELGLLGWLRSRYLRRRYLTCILYLNETEVQKKEKEEKIDDDDTGKKGAWTQEDGGYLRLFIGADKSDDTGESIISKQTASQETGVGTRIVDIEPKGGRIVIFSSEHILHAVLPSFRRRIACTVWLTLNGD